MAVDVRAIQAAHPDWGVVDAIPAIDGSGGIWAVNAQGAVFGLDANGNPGGAKYFGAYNQHPEWGAGTAARTITAIRTDPDTGGYTLISNQPGQNYTFHGDRPLGGDQDKPQIAAPTKGVDFSASDQAGLENTLKQHGLGDLVNIAWDYYKDPTKGAGDATKVLDWLPTTTQYRDHFPGLVELGEKGRAWTPAQWNTYYNTLQDEAVSAGLPPGMVDRADVGKMLIGGVSIGEATGRIQAAGQSVHNADPTVIGQMRRLGFTDGDLTAFYLDPDKAAPLLERKAQEEQGRIAAAAQRTGFDPALSLGTAQRLQSFGVNEAEAEKGFSTLSDLHPLFSNTVGETAAGEQITTEEQLGATFEQNTAAAQEIATRRARRQANFQGGGGASTGGSGRTGLGGS